MSDITPVSVRTIQSPNGPSVAFQRQFSLTGSPMPEEVHDMIMDGFGNISNEDAEAVHQFLLSKSPSSELDDIKITLHRILSGDILPDKNEIVQQIRHQLTDELTNKSLDDIVEFHKDVLNKEFGEIERMAEETGNWTFYLRAAKKREALNEISDTIS